ELVALDGVGVADCVEPGDGGGECDRRASGGGLRGGGRGELQPADRLRPERKDAELGEPVPWPRWADLPCGRQRVRTRPGSQDALAQAERAVDGHRRSKREATAGPWVAWYSRRRACPALAGQEGRLAGDLAEPLPQPRADQVDGLADGHVDLVPHQP